MSTPATLEGVIDTAADAIHRQFSSELDRDIRDRIAEWSELHGFERLDEPHLVVARQAAFNVLLKATLYEHYHQRGILPELGADGREAFLETEEIIGDPAFGEYVLDDVAWLADRDDLEDVLDARHQLVSSKEPAEEIGRLFESLTPQESRRKLGQFRTPMVVASLMADWIIDDGTETVLDPGMGACALSAATYRKKREAVDEPTLSDIYGVDINELALVMGACTLNLLDHGGPHNLRAGDFLELSAEDIDGPVDSIISNPPYSRHHELSEEYKKRINARIEGELSRDVSALSPLYAYFYYHTSQLLTPGGYASYITPSEFLETGYGGSLKQFLLDEFEITALVLFDRGEDSVFAEAMTTSLVSFLKKSDENSGDPFTRFIRVDKFPGEDVLLDAITDGVEGTTDWGFVNIVQQEGLEPADKWSELFDPIEVDTSQLSPLSELATVNRGIATGANDFFCLSQADVDDWDIEEYASPLVRNSRSVPYYDYRKEDWEEQRDDGDEVWILYHLDNLKWDAKAYQRQQETADNARLNEYMSGKSSDESSEQPKVVEYLKHGMGDDVEAHDSYLARNREPWYVVDRREPAPVLVTYMSRGGCRFILNETNARNLNNLHGVYVDADLEDQQLKALLAYLNSGFADDVVRRSGRTYSTGMDKIEPNELESVPVLDPRELSNESVDKLAGLFDELREAVRNGEETTASMVAEIDTLLKQEMGHD